MPIAAAARRQAVRGVVAVGRDDRAAQGCGAGDDDAIPGGIVLIGEGFAAEVFAVREPSRAVEGVADNARGDGQPNPGAQALGDNDLPPLYFLPCA